MARRQDPAADVASSEASVPPRGETMLPPRKRRRPAETVFMRVIATAGVVAIGVALGAILASSDVAGWIIGLVVALVSVVLAAILWSSRQL